MPAEGFAEFCRLWVEMQAGTPAVQSEPMERLGYVPEGRRQDN